MLHWGISDSVTGISDRKAIRATVLKSLELAPNAIELYSLVSQVSREEEAAETLEIVDRGLKIDPLSPVLLDDRARQLNRLGRVDEGLAIYAHLREIAPDSVYGYNSPAILFMHRGPYVEAVYWYARAAQVDRDDHELPANAAQLLLTLGMTTEASPWMVRAELLNASGSDTRRVEIQYAERSGDVARAIALSAQVLRARRDNRRSVYDLAAVHYLTLMDEAGRLDEALAFLDTVSPGYRASPPAAVASEFDLAIQGVATPYLVRGADAVTRAMRIKHMHDEFSRMSPEFDYEHEYVGALFAALDGDEARARTILLRVLADPDKLPWDWHISVLRDPLVGGLTHDPEVAAAIAKLEADFAAQTERYHKLVADGEIRVP